MTQKPTVTVRFSGIDAHKWPQAELDELGGALSRDSFELILEPPQPPEPGIYASLTAVGIFLAGVVTTKVLDSVLKDAYDGAKGWLRRRFEKDENADAVVVTIYGPDGKPLKSVLGRPPNVIKDLDV